ncbi:RNase H domain-containing protein [Trichonephila clavipes]|nr:RNase H domain-containing protein [Trichonephila clavipes]
MGTARVLSGKRTMINPTAPIPNFRCVKTGQTIIDKNIGERLSTADSRAAGVGNAIKGFEKCGIETHNPLVFSEHDFAASKAIDHDVVGDETENNSANAQTLKSELIAISGALDHVFYSYKDSIWSLTDSRSSLQYLKNWPKIMDSTGLEFLSELVRLGQRKKVCLQWILSHVGVPGNEAADELPFLVANHVEKYFLLNAFS